MKISACIITYNHEQFIRKCLEGAIAQKLDIDYEIIIGEDLSSDKTFEICYEYASRYPDLITLISGPSNLGMVDNWIRTIQNCSGNYIAICEGDDYWTDPFKLQKQVEFLNCNPAFSICGHGVLVDNGSPIVAFQKKFSYSFNFVKYISLGKKFATCTLVFRNKFLDSSIINLIKTSSFVDFPLEAGLLIKGPGFYFKNVMATYRKQPSGATSSKNFYRKSMYLKFKLLLQIANGKNVRIKLFCYIHSFRFYLKYLKNIFF